MIFISGMVYNVSLRGVSPGYFPIFIYEQRSSNKNSVE